MIKSLFESAKLIAAKTKSKIKDRSVKDVAPELEKRLAEVRGRSAKDAAPELEKRPAKEVAP